jgi:hypothetical protein
MVIHVTFYQNKVNGWGGGQAVFTKLMVTHITKIYIGNYNKRKKRITVSSRILNHDNLYT